jgi:hypothetical protein
MFHAIPDQKMTREQALRHAFFSTHGTCHCDHCEAYRAAHERLLQHESEQQKRLTKKPMFSKIVFWVWGKK